MIQHDVHIWQVIALPVRIGTIAQYSNLCEFVTRKNISSGHGDYRPDLNPFSSRSTMRIIR